MDHSSIQTTPRVYSNLLKDRRDKENEKAMEILDNHSIFENIHRFFLIILDQFFGVVQIDIPYKTKNPIILANTHLYQST